MHRCGLGHASVHDHRTRRRPELGDDQLEADTRTNVVDLAEWRDERRTWPWLRTTVAVVAVAIIAITFVVWRNVGGPASAAKQPADPHEVTARAWVHAHRNVFTLPSDATPLATPPSTLASAQRFPQHDRLVSETSYWQSALPVRAVARLVRAHKPAGFTSNGTGSSSTEGRLDELDQRFDAGPIAAGKQRVVWLAYEPYHGGGKPR